MLSDNRIISVRQAKRLFLLDGFFMTTFILPHFLLGEVGRDGILIYIFAAVLIVLFLCLTMWTLSEIKTDFISYIKKNFGGFLSVALGVLLLLQYYLTGMMILSLLGNLVGETLLKGNSYWMVFVIGAVAVWSVFHGMESRARQGSVLVCIVLVTFLFMVLFSVKGIQIERISPLCISSIKKLRNSTYDTVGICAMISMSFLCVPCMKENGKKSIVVAVTSAAFLGVILFAMIIGGMGVDAARTARFPGLQLMTTARFPGGFIKRCDGFMIISWLFAGLVMLGGCFLYEGLLLEQVTERKKYPLYLCIMAGITYISVILAGDYEAVFWLYKLYMCYIGVPVIGITLLMLIYCKLRGKRKEKH